LLDQPVGQGRLPMIYVGDYAKVADEREFSHAAPLAGPPRPFKHGGKAVGALCDGVRDGGGHHAA
jgi:hypothetical protein